MSDESNTNTPETVNEVELSHDEEIVSAELIEDNLSAFQTETNADVAASRSILDYDGNTIMISEDSEGGGKHRRAIRRWCPGSSQARCIRRA
jgi:hypothetical protein